MRSKKFANLFPDKRKIAIFIGAIIFLTLSVSACTIAQPEEETDVELAVEQTLTAIAEVEAAAQTAEAESQSVFGTAVAAAVASQISAVMPDVVPEATATTAPAADTTVDTEEAEVVTEETTQECEQDCEQVCDEACDARIEDEVQTRVAATATQRKIDVDKTDVIRDLLTQEAAPAGPVGSGGGPAEEDACKTGEIICAENITDSNVNVREGPGVQWNFIMALEPGESVPVECRLQNDWLMIIWSINRNRTGWVDGSFMLVYRGEDTRPTVPICEDIPPTPKIFPTVTPTPTPTPTSTQTQTPTVTPTPSATPKPDIGIFVFNGSDADICRLEVYLASNTSGSNRLGSDETLDPLETKAIKLSGDREGKIYKFKAWECGDDKYDPPFDQAEREIKEGMTWTITNP